MAADLALTAYLIIMCTRMLVSAWNWFPFDMLLIAFILFLLLPACFTQFMRVCITLFTVFVVTSNYGSYISGDLSVPEYNKKYEIPLVENWDEGEV